MKSFLDASNEALNDYAYIINNLNDYAKMNLFVIQNSHSATISLSFVLPFAFRLENEGCIHKGDLPIRLDGPSVITEEVFLLIKTLIENMNFVLSTIIPGLSIDIHDFGTELLKNNKVGHKIELYSIRDNTRIPLKYESEGVIKIISILNVLLCVYNKRNMCLVIDEFDAGIFEYLLGELLSIFEKGAKGQLIFTSHNLRALEMIDKKSIFFSTTNPYNRYIRLQNVKSNNNLRDMYLRSILLGGQKEDVYNETDSVEIGRAFRKAGKVICCE
jgi:AAA15 family ATPase/GTPase